jgi:hypothetical protein
MWKSTNPKDRRQLVQQEEETQLGKKPDMYRRYRWEIIGKELGQIGILSRES